MWKKNHTCATTGSQTRAPFRATLAAGGGWPHAPPKGGAMGVQARAPGGHDLWGLVLAKEELVEAAIGGDRSADLSRVDRLARFDEVRDPAGFQELGDEPGVGRGRRFFLGGGVTTLDQHALDQPIHLRQGLRGGIDHQGLETLPLRLPVVPIDAGFDHGRGMRAYDPFETLLA